MVLKLLIIIELYCKIKFKGFFFDFVMEKT